VEPELPAEASPEMSEEPKSENADQVEETSEGTPIVTSPQEPANTSTTPPTSRLEALPAEIHLMIFTHLRPIERRILGTTSQAMRDIWKDKKFFDTLIRINADEFMSLDSNSQGYRDIVRRWTDPACLFERSTNGMRQNT
jgi:hypothetical protein